ncbi:ethanolamine ammonia-lyase subunit EutC [Azoarcus sp. TTM-91]|uniref:ethanolamine ammonia-lyase subunit EutC n=1 Tax=Azoarcus sp. TTM-91 TaxID=2691581 RepID=UPI00145F168E|nr:ethanolamine ammonia-lyase subunit EutC [Azoarcus sp. TTM-91]NMG36550.1 ethanolamine ammonia-lyase subunit EutC [Azoarcus sp. TTM-91]
MKKRTPPPADAGPFAAGTAAPGAIDADPWTDLRRYTAARLALGRAGASLPTAEVLRFGLAHAKARDAVHLALDAEALQAALAADGCATLRAHSAAADRASYLARPDLGRKLAADSAAALRAQADPAGCDLLLVVADGLSSLAVERNARALVAEIRRGLPAGWTLGPVVVATQARVALADEIGQALGARLVAMLIGERPGLSSPDSLGLYLTWAPRPGRSDAQRNCISNIRPEGLGHAEAARRLWWLCEEARRLGLTGVALKDNSEGALPGAGPPLALPAAAPAPDTGTQDKQ